VASALPADSHRFSAIAQGTNIKRALAAVKVIGFLASTRCPLGELDRAKPLTPSTAVAGIRIHRPGVTESDFCRSTAAGEPNRLTGATGVTALGVPASFVTTDSTAAPGAVLDGVDIVVLADPRQPHHFAGGALVRVLPGWQCPFLPLHLVTPTTRKRAARVLALTDLPHAELLRPLCPQVETRFGERAAQAAGLNLEQVACRTAAGSARQSDLGLTVAGGALE
jgi:LysR family transcriptional regulator for bpeEF and oprC